MLFGEFVDVLVVWWCYLEVGILICDVGIFGYLWVIIGLVEENDVFLWVSVWIVIDLVFVICSFVGVL